MTILFPVMPYQRNLEFYMLRWGWSSPLLDGVTLQGIPLYKIPYTQPDHPCYDNVWSWYRQAEALYRLWLGSQISK